MEERGHVLQVLKKVKDELRKEDSLKLKELSNQTIHSASIHQDADSIMIAVVVYSLSKIIERTDYQKYPGWKKLISHLSRHIDKAIIALKQNKDEVLRQELKSAGQDISKLTGNFKKHIQNVFQKARINKASRIYEHGISMEKTSKLLGISIWELAEYAGQTGISDVNLNITMPMKARIKLAMDIFK